jgi:ribokinase
MITVFGSINVDLVTRVDAHPRPGETIAGSDYRLIPGGKGANQALAAARAGASVRLIGAVGTDAFAAVALSELGPGGVDLAGVARRQTPTGLALIVVDATGENTIVVAAGANRTVAAADADAVTFGKDDTLLLQLEVPYAEGRKLALRARAAGSRVILSVAPFRPLSVEDAAPASVLIMNEHEAAALAGHVGLTAGSDAENAVGLAKIFGRTVIATLGADGAIAAEGGGTLGTEGAIAAEDGTVLRVPALAVTPVDTTGAGDTFAGVLAVRLDAGATLGDAMAYAAAAGSLSTTREGAQPSFPMRAEIDAALAAAGARRPTGGRRA